MSTRTTAQPPATKPWHAAAKLASIDRISQRSDGSTLTALGMPETKTSASAQAASPHVVPPS
ncbi:hypothetical protein [Nocardia abscessus]|uniref:hypothetical protein n=1 Tax=Nocardia abscessus TaxID=120957 RepID=UPI002454B410|nr:hypothetical protein [Nocardia abscessus]